MNYLKLILILPLLASTLSCKKETLINEGNDPNFKIVANDDGVLKDFNRKVEVFGIRIYAVKKVSDVNLLHTANVMAQYLDNDEDGEPDNPAVVDEMVRRNAFMVLWKNQRDLNTDLPDGWEGQDLGNGETHPEFVKNGRTGTFDAALEEVLHLITHVGYAGVYPDVWGESAGTSLSDAMDIARGGHFQTIPGSYPTEAWYTYDDNTCEYNCMATEYIYWALTSILGAQENRLPEIEQEWKLNTAEKVMQSDSTIYQLLTDTSYHFPTTLPDGSYR